MAEPILEVRGLKDGVDFAIHAGETLGLIGESGCGKITTPMLILLQEAPTEGTIAFDGRDIAGLAGRELMGYRRRCRCIRKILARLGLVPSGPRPGPAPPAPGAATP